MDDQQFGWLQDGATGWGNGVPITKVDTHHHFVPDFYRQAIESTGGDPSGWPTPPWTKVGSELAMKRLGVKTAILSCTAPGASVLQGQASFDLARKINEYAAHLRDEQPDRFGFFATLPCLLETKAALTELEYALDTLHADGVTLFTRYGDSNTYLGHPSLEPVWTELNRRKCVVFVHPTHPVDTNLVNPKMLQLLIDYPHETTRTAMDMIISGTRDKYPDCKVILSHAGGALPYLISRASALHKKTPDDEETAARYERAFRSFYFDLALSATPAVLKMALELIPHDHILYGSDFPYATPPSYPVFLEQLESFEMTPQLREMINYKNAYELFPRLAGKKDH